MLLAQRQMDYCDKSVVLQWAQSPPVPQGTKPLPHQVAGHVFGRDNGHKKNKIGEIASIELSGYT